MQNIDELIKSLEMKATELANRVVYLDNQNKKLDEENKNLSQQIVLKDKDISKLNEEKEVLTLANSLKEENGNGSESKERINEIVKEIDKCLTILNK